MIRKKKPAWSLGELPRERFFPEEKASLAYLDLLDSGGLASFGGLGISSDDIPIAKILQQVNNGAVRPKTPLYQVVSVAISHLVSPPDSINPVSTEQSLRTQINNALSGKGLTP